MAGSTCLYGLYSELLLHVKPIPRVTRTLVYLYVFVIFTIALELFDSYPIPHVVIPYVCAKKNYETNLQYYSVSH